MAQWFLKFRVNIKVEDLLPVVFFFQDKNNGDEYKIQFKYARLSDFCYICGLLNLSQGITTNVYGPWIQAEHLGCMTFINSTDEEDDRFGLANREKIIHNMIKFELGNVQSKVNQSQNDRAMEEKTNLKEKL